MSRLERIEKPYRKALILLNNESLGPLSEEKLYCYTEPLSWFRGDSQNTADRSHNHVLLQLAYSPDLVELFTGIRFISEQGTKNLLYPVLLGWNPQITRDGKIV